MHMLVLALLALLAFGSPAEAYRAVATCPSTAPLYTAGATSVEPMVDLNGNTCVASSTDASQAPQGATQVQTSATGTTGATASALAATTAVTNYICGFSVRSNATAAVTGTITVAGILGGTLSFAHFAAPLASGIGQSSETFYPCLPASAVNTAITVTGPAPGAGGTISTTVWGYRR